MTKEEYLNNALMDYLLHRSRNANYQNRQTMVGTEVSNAFGCGFEAGCKYYRNNVLELKDLGK